jgi:UDP-N-acetylglucosamine acyltransferase
MGNIHPTAIIHPEAQLAEYIVIGPYVCIEGPARIGAGTVIHAHAVISGEVIIGERNTIGHGAIIGTYPQDLSYKPDARSGVIIGNDNVIRELSTIHRGTGEGTYTRVGDRNFLMAGSHLAHNVQMGNNVIMANNALLGGHVKVEDRVFIGGGSVFHQGIRIGRLVMAQGISAASKDVPPYCVLSGPNGIAGLNVVGLRRAGFQPETRAEVKSAFKLLFQSGLNITQAIAAAKEKSWGAEAGYFWEFVESATSKGICSLATRLGSP